MGRELIQPDGSIVYRTKLFRNLALASAFARCVKANSTRFTDVFVNASDSPRTKGDAWYVTFRPVNRERHLDMLERQQDARKQRGYTEGLDYIFWPDPDKCGVWWCFNPLSGESYEVTSFECTCADFTYRCNKAGLNCKHQHALEAQAVSARRDKQVPIPARKPGDFIKANAALDFP